MEIFQLEKRNEMKSKLEKIKKIKPKYWFYGILIFGISLLIEALLLYWIIPLDLTYWKSVRWVFLYELILSSIFYRHKGGKSIW